MLLMIFASRHLSMCCSPSFRLQSLLKLINLAQPLSVPVLQTETGSPAACFQPAGESGRVGIAPGWGALAGSSTPKPGRKPPVQPGAGSWEGWEETGRAEARLPLPIPALGNSIAGFFPWQGTGPSAGARGILFGGSGPVKCTQNLVAPRDDAPAGGCDGPCRRI